ncbi:MAG: hypothetical protein KDB16_17625, partial [Acidimicrobiales bacterium]|nr:hypothetical protein [Acidimicrobiales bacterium]
MGMGAVLRRWRADGATAAAVAATVVTAMVMLAAGPIFADAVSVASLRQAVVAGSAAEVTVEVAIAGTERPGVDYDDQIRRQLGAALAPLEAQISRHVQAGGSFSPSTAAPDELTVVAELSSLEGLEAHAGLVEGSWPTHDASTVQVVAATDVAAQMDLDVGDGLELQARVGNSATLSARLVGIFEIEDRNDPFWVGRDRVATGVLESTQFRTLQLVTSEESLLRASTTWASSWLALPDLSKLEPGDALRVAGRVSALGTSLTRSLQPTDLVRNESWSIGVSSELPANLTGNTDALTVTRSTVGAAIAGVAVVAGSALVLMAALTFDSRRSDAAWWTARGASPGQLLQTVVAEATLVVVPSVVMAPVVAVAILGRFDGVFASGIDVFEPRLVASSYLVVALAGVGAVALLAWPTWRANRPTGTGRGDRRLQLPGGVQRAGADLALVCLAGVAYWQLRATEAATSSSGRLGVSPLVAAAPTLGLLAASIIAIRAVPLLAGLAERLLPRSKGAVGSLAAWQLARRQGRYRHSALLLLVATAFGVYALTFSSTWDRSQRDRADHLVGADIRAQVLGGGGSVAEPYLAVALEAIPGVDSATAAALGNVDVQGADRARLLAIDTTNAPSISDRFDGSSSFEAALEALAARRPQLPAWSLPDGITRLDIGYEVAVVQPPTGDTASMAASAGVWVSDGRGLLHHFDLGPLDTSGDPGSVALNVVGPDGSAIVGPIAIVEFELIAVGQRGVDTGAQVRLGPFDATLTDTGRTQLDAGSVAWQASIDVLSGFNRGPALAVDRSGEVLRIDLRTGTSFNQVPVKVRLRPPGPEPAATVGIVAPDSWLDDRSVAVGDVVQASFTGIDPARAEVVAAVGLIPVLDPSP